VTILKYLGENRYEGLDEVVAIAREVGWGAAEVLQSFYTGDRSGEDLQIQKKKGGPVTAADVAANDYILNNLQASFGNQDFGYLSEETHQSGSPALLQPWVWIIDPLDGTRDFIDKTGEYAVHIALVHEGQPILSVVPWPETGKLYYATKGGGTFVETRDGQVRQLHLDGKKATENLTLVVSRTHRDERFKQLLEQLSYKNKHYVGSVGCKIITLLEHRADVYISLSGKSAPKDWDFAAPELILTEAGGHFTHADGTPLKYNQGDVTQWGCVIASNGEYHPALCEEAATILSQLDS